MYSAATCSHHFRRIDHQTRPSVTLYDKGSMMIGLMDEQDSTVASIHFMADDVGPLIDTLIRELQNCQSQLEEMQLTCE